MVTSRISSLAAEIRTWLTTIGGSALLSWKLSVPPAPASRPNVTRWNGIYYGKPYERFRQDARLLAEKFEGVPTDKPVVMLLEFVKEKPKTGKMPYPSGDVDNYAKGPLDVMTQAGRFFDDDNQVVGLTVWKRYNLPGEEAGVYVDWITLDDL